MPKGEHEMGPLVLVIALLIFAVGFFVGRASKQTVTSQRGGPHTVKAEDYRSLPSDRTKETAMNGDVYPYFGPSDPLETPIFDGAFGPSDSSFTDGSFQMPPPSQGSESVTSRAGRVIPDFGPPDPLDTPIFDSAFGPSDSSFPGDGGGFQMSPVSPHDRRIEMPIFDGAFGPSDANKPQETIVKDADGKEYRLIPLK